MPVLNTKLQSAFIFFWLIFIPLSYNFWGLDPALNSKFFLWDVSLLAALVILYFNKSKLRVFKASALIFTGLYIISVALAGISLSTYSINTADGWFQWLQLVSFPIFIFILLLVHSVCPVSRQAVAENISYMALLSLVIGLAQFGFQDNSERWSLSAADVVTATYGNKNIFSEVLLLTLPFSCYAYYNSTKRWFGWIAAATFLFMVILLSRAVWVATCTGGLVALIIYDIVAGRRRVKLQTAVLTTALVAALFLSIYWVLHHTSGGNRLAGFFNHRGTISERKNLWRTTTAIIQSHLWLGTGLGSWKILGMKYSLLGLRNYTTFFRQPHNDTLWIICEQGLLSFLVLLAAWLYLAFLLIRHIIRRPDEPFYYGLLFALTGYWVYSNFSFPRERAEHSIILGFIAFFILSNEEEKPIKRFPTWALIVAAVPVLGAAWWAGNKVLNENRMFHALECRTSGNTDKELNYLARINSVYYSTDITATPVAWYTGMVYYNKNDLNDALGNFMEGLRYNPYHAYSLSNVGTCLSAMHRPNEAESYFREALEYSAGFPDAALNLCAIKFNKGETDSAAYYLLEANDSIADARYSRFAKAIIASELRPLITNANAGNDTLMLRLCETLSGSASWQIQVLKKSFYNKISIHKQIALDFVWVLRIQEKNPGEADYYQKIFNLEPDE